jgi:hypothetical protein
MAYSDFTSLTDLKKRLQLTFKEELDLFQAVPRQEASAFLQQTLKDTVPLALAIDTEKARSELIVIPILVELKKSFSQQVSLFSGITFNVDADQGLTGICDFLISKSSEQLFITAPVIMLVEAKNDNLKSGLGQCVAEMLAARIFNEREGNEIKTIYGVVTTGSQWKFLQLTEQVVSIDLKEYYLQDLEKILGILALPLRMEEINPITPSLT